MSADLYYRRLCYVDKRGGIAKEGDLKLELHAPPIVLANAIEISFGEIHPGVLAYDPYIVRSGGAAKDDMSPPEIIAVRRWLFGLLFSVMRAAAIAVPMVNDRREKPR